MINSADVAKKADEIQRRYPDDTELPHDLTVLVVLGYMLGIQEGSSLVRSVVGDVIDAATGQGRR